MPYLLGLFILLSPSFAYAKDSRPLFSKKEISELEWYKSFEYLHEKTIMDLKKSSRLKMNKILGIYVQSEKAKLLKELNESPWKRVDQRDFKEIQNRLLMEILNSGE